MNEIMGRTSCFIYCKELYSKFFVIIPYSTEKSKHSFDFFKKDAPASDIFSFHNNKILLSVAGRKLAGPYFLVRKEYSTLIFRKQ